MSNSRVKADELASVVIKFAGDSGDGMQLTGTQFTHSSALAGNDLSTFPDFPAEIRAPAGTLAGVSGFVLQIGSVEINTPGDKYDVLVAMNAAAFKKNIEQLERGGILILNTDGFESKNLKLAGYEAENNPLEDQALEAQFTVYRIDITRLTRESLKDSPLAPKEKDRCKNMFVLGFLYWMFDRSLDHTLDFLSRKFTKTPDVLAANEKVLRDGHHFGETTEVFTSRYTVTKAPLEPGLYRNVMGNQATAIGLIAFAVKSGIDLFYGSYPITPASDILHELSRHRDMGLKTFQAEDEIAAVAAAIGASFGGSLGVCGTSGPGMALKSEAMGLAVMAELPLVIIDVQRAGPSTGMPTKTEQADLFQAMYGRHGESPVAILAARTPSDCFRTTIEACRIAVEHMCPVILLSDGYLGNGSEPWLVPDLSDFPEIKRKNTSLAGDFSPYERDEKHVRPWVVPGQAGGEHRIGGLEKDDISGNVSYVPANHEQMTRIRREKIERIADAMPAASLEIGPEKGRVLVVGWGSTYGAIRSALLELLDEGHTVAHLQLRMLNPFPRNLEEVLDAFDHVLVPEINDGQLVRILRAEYGRQFHALNKVRGLPFSKAEIKSKVRQLLNDE